jgi:hypothetical protein
VGFCESIKILPNGTYARNLCGEYESWWIDEFPEYKNFVDYCFDGDESQAPFDKNTFDDLRDCDIPEWEKMLFPEKAVFIRTSFEPEFT